MLVMMGATHARHGADPVRSAASSWRCSRMSGCPGSSRVSVAGLLLLVGIIVSRMVPLFRADAGASSTRVNHIMREQLTGIRVVRAFVREPSRSARFRARQHRHHGHRARVGSLFVLMFPVVDARDQRLQSSR